LEGRKFLQKLLRHPQVEMMAVDILGEIPLHEACRSDSSRCVALLLSHHLEKYELLQLNPLKVGEPTPLHIACYYSKEDKAVRQLLHHVNKMNINAQAWNGNTPLHMTVLRQQRCFTSFW
jgi:ankyrin repeat protein